jgi:transcription factor TFIIIB component B''
MGVFQAIAPIPYDPPGAVEQEAAQHALNNVGTGNTQKLALNAHSTVKPKRSSVRRKGTVAVVADGTPGHAESTADEQNDGPSTGKAKGEGIRGKKARAGDTDHEDSPKRKRKTARNETNAEGKMGRQKQKRSRTTPSGTPRPRKSRDRSHPLFDANMDPGEDIDPTVITMAALCNDTGQGRISRKAAEIQSNHAAWKAQNKEKRARMKSVMELKKYGRDERRGGTNKTASATLEDISLPGPSMGSTHAFSRGTPVEDQTGNDFDYSQDLTTSRFNVQVRIGPNGETIIDEESLIVDRNEDDDTETYTHIVESDNTKFVNSGSYGRRYRGSRWSADETERFYDVSRMFRNIIGRYSDNSTGSLPIW